MNIYSLGVLLKEEEKIQLKSKYQVIHWGVSSKDIQTQLKINWIELELHPKMIEDFDMQVLDLLLSQNSKQDIKVFLIRIQSIDIRQSRCNVRGSYLMNFTLTRDLEGLK